MLGKSAAYMNLLNGYDRNLLYYILQTRYVGSYFNDALTGSTIKNLGLTTIRFTPIALPPTKAEQTAIANALSDADALISSLEKLIEKKRAIKQGAMQELLTGRKRLPGFEVVRGYKETEVGLVPEDWEVKRLGQLGKFFKGSGVRKDECDSGNLPCIRYGELYTKHNDLVRHFFSWISENVALTATRLRTGDLLFAGSGETKEEIGKCVAFLLDLEAYAGGDIVILRQDSEDSLFLGYYLNSPPIVNQKASRGQGDAVVHIGSNALGEILILFPSKPEQTAIAEILFNMDSEIEALEIKLSKQKFLKQAMMQELLTGKTRLI